MPVISLGAAAFWIGLAAVLIGGQFYKSRSEALRHQTLLRLMEKTGRLDEEQMKLLFPAPPPPLPHVCGPPPRQPDGRRGLKIFGTIVLSIAAGLDQVGARLVTARFVFPPCARIVEAA